MAWRAKPSAAVDSRRSIRRPEAEPEQTEVASSISSPSRTRSAAPHRRRCTGAPPLREAAAGRY
jgi:hypothetical protein